MKVEDFGGVETFEGHYEVTDGELSFVRDRAQPVSSAERTVSEKGYATLLEHISARLKRNVSNEVDVDILIPELTEEGVESEVSVSLSR
jgi:hypothetical protein